MSEDRRVTVIISKDVVESQGFGVVTEVIAGLKADFTEELANNGRAQILLTVE